MSNEANVEIWPIPAQEGVHKYWNDVKPCISFSPKSELGPTPELYHNTIYYNILHTFINYYLNKATLHSQKIMATSTAMSTIVFVVSVIDTNVTCIVTSHPIGQIHPK